MVDRAQLMQTGRRFFLAIFATATPLLPLSAFGADPGVCKNYAEFAVEDFNRGTYGANQQRCKIQRDARWHDNVQAHYKWCLTATDAALRSEEKARKDRLTNCLSSRID